ncbi:MAG TPA: ABC transporter ATP-binding protein [Longimicrobiales bacterium]|nr:ABC transporter ATP-binding protein [Longimicrobiales bacterium]
MSNAIELRDVGYRAGKTFEIRDLDLRVPVGSIYGFLGPNGSGKTTTIRLFLGMLRPHAGDIRVLGSAVPGELPGALARIGFVPERPHLYPTLSVEEAICYHRAFYPTWDDGFADQLRRRLALRPEQRLKRLSKGEMGKLLILLALAQRPELLVLDEPTDGLDPVVRRDVLTAVLDYVSEAGATVFISSHLVNELERICDWVGVMDGGRLVAELPMQSFKNGIKRLRVVDAPALADDPPFVILARHSGNGVLSGETWVVRGWQDPMRQYFDGIGATLKEVVDLDLEESFVELLRSSRTVAEV